LDIGSDDFTSVLDASDPRPFTVVMIGWLASICTVDDRPKPKARVFEAAAVVRSENHAIVASERTGVLSKLHVKMADPVKKGDLIAEFSCAEQLANMAAAKAQSDQSGIELKTQERLFQKGATGENAVAVARAIYNQKNALYSAEIARTDTCSIKSPFDGHVVAIMSQEYSFLKTGEPVVELTDKKKLYIDVIVPSELVPTLRKGDEALFVSDAGGDGVLVVIDRVGVAIDPVSQTSNLHAVFQSGDPLFSPGQSGRVVFGIED